jgi:hypothetical protein
MGDVHPEVAEIEGALTPSPRRRRTADHCDADVQYDEGGEDAGGQGLEIRGQQDALC